MIHTCLIPRPNSGKNEMLLSNISTVNMLGTFLILCLNSLSEWCGIGIGKLAYKKVFRLNVPMLAPEC